MSGDEVRLRWLRADTPVDDATRDAVVDCWRATADAGGAVGFPWPPVARAEVAAAVDRLLEDVADGRTLVLLCEDGTVPGGDGTAGHAAALVGWVSLALNTHTLTRHWASVHRLQSHPDARDRGIGRVLLTEVERLARDELGLERLHLEVRGGMDLEGFYRHLGWREVGRWPRALRLTDDDVRDELLFDREL